jgi:structural maintenance of chromosome 4
VQEAAVAAVQELAHHEKREVELKERRKHVSTKAKKMKKSLTDVSDLTTGFKSLTNKCYRTRTP